MSWVQTLVVFLALGATAAAASADFPKPRSLVPQVEFWKRVFADWSEHQVAIHDDLYLDKVYSVVDLRSEARTLGEDALYRLRKQRTDAEKARIDGILRQIHAQRGRPEGLDSEERRIFEMFRDVPGDSRFLAARGRIRAQQGLRERFARGVEISRRYMAHMEEVFRREGLPLELTRMPFVESTFNVKAYSKVGAAGIWQFIPSSARIYGLQMNEVVDDRRDPWRATVAAARHLRDDYARLGAWPLAVTAYNHGRGGIARAVATTGSRDIAEIIRRYRGRSFGFASRNFYTSFLAALEVEAEHEKHFGPLRLEPPLAFEEVSVPDYVGFGTLARAAGMEVEAFHELNPAFERLVVEGKLYVPKGASVRVPGGRAQEFRRQYAAVPATERFGAQRRYFVEHRVQPGQTVGTIARRYRTSVAAIQAANNLRSVHRIRVGQLLRIPTGGGQSRSGGVRHIAGHRVSEGDTLGKIARRYGTSVAALQEANGMGSSTTIRVGQVLRLPGAATSKRSARLQHTVRQGQTVGGIAERYGTTVSAIRDANGLQSADEIRAGQVLTIPTG